MTARRKTIPREQRRRPLVTFTLSIEAMAAVDVLAVELGLSKSATMEPGRTRASFGLRPRCYPPVVYSWTVNDLPAKPSSGALAERYEHAETVYSVLGSTARRGPWKPPETMRTVSVLGSIVLDYRDADLPLGVTEVDCQVFLGSVEIVVPSDVDVELTGSVFLGSVETKSGKGRRRWLRRARERLVGQEPEPEEEYERPLLSVDCSGALGSVEVKLG